jgi:CspA family cold shock protein
MQGTVIWYLGTKGYGFIAPDDGGTEVFVHWSAVEDAGLDDLREGQRLVFETEMGPKSKIQACALVVPK